MTPELYRPVLDCFLRALPHTYRTVTAPPGARIAIEVIGPCGGEWHLYRSRDGWMLTAEPAGDPVARVSIPDAVVWRSFTKGIGRAKAEALVAVEGERHLGLHLLTARAVLG